MSDRYLRHAVNELLAPVLTAQGVERGDLVKLSSGNIVRAADETWVTDLATTQTNFVKTFLGVSEQRKVAAAARIVANPADNIILVATSGVYEFDTASASYNVGDLVGPAKDTGNLLLNQTVAKVTDVQQAIGTVTEATTSATKVQVRILSNVVGLSRLPAVAGGGAATYEANTALTTAGAGTLTAAALSTGVITRTGPVAAYTDTTDTAVAIIAALAEPVGYSQEILLRNTTAFTATLAGGVGVTLSGNTLIPPNSVYRGLLTIATGTTVTLLGLAVYPLTTPPLLVSTALTTAGAGTITAAGIAGGVTSRSGPTGAFTDTTDTGTNIQAALPNANVGQSWTYVYTNTTNFLGTFAAGAGVTVSGVTSCPANAWVEFLVTLTALNTVTMVAVAMGPNAALPDAQYTTAALQSAVIPAANMAGAKYVAFENTGTTPANLQSDTAANIVAGIPNARIGMSYVLTVRNSSGSANTATITTNTGITLHGTMTIAQNVTRTFLVVLTSLSAVDIYSMGISAAGA